MIAIRKVISGLLPECRAISEVETIERRQTEAAVAKAIVELQQVVVKYAWCV